MNVGLEMSVIYFYKCHVFYERILKPFMKIRVISMGCNLKHDLFSAYVYRIVYPLVFT